ncbi:hypothetical protein [Sorangium sp. So ce693]|uniref:hypothetical protein n=1 Tax=Sorangium sp. So ce693 TaxID=3133318 RepID=UPI003F5DDA72
MGAGELGAVAGVAVHRVELGHVAGDVEHGRGLGMAPASGCMGSSSAQRRGVEVDAGELVAVAGVEISLVELRSGLGVISRELGARVSASTAPARPPIGRGLDGDGRTPCTIPTAWQRCRLYP